MWKYTGEKKDIELLDRIKKQVSEDDYWRLVQWHNALMWHIEKAQKEINELEMRINQP